MSVPREVPRKILPVFALASHVLPDIHGYLWKFLTPPFQLLRLHFHITVLSLFQLTKKRKPLLPIHHRTTASHMTLQSSSSVVVNGAAITAPGDLVVGSYQPRKWYDRFHRLPAQKSLMLRMAVENHSAARQMNRCWGHVWLLFGIGLS